MKKLLAILILLGLTLSANAQVRSVMINPSTGQLVKSDNFGNFTNFFLMNIFWLTNALNTAGYDPGGGSGVVDGDKGDISVSGGVWSLDAGVVANAEVAAGAAIDATKLGDGTVDNTELGRLNGITANVQDQIDGLAAAGVSDGDKGDITVTASGLTWTVDTGLSATKVADGSVSNTEFQHLNGVTSTIQTQIDGKLANVVEDTTPQLGGNLDALGKNISNVHNLSLTNYSATKTHGLDGIMVNNWLDPSQITTNIYGPFKYQAAFIGATDGGILMAGKDSDGSHVTEMTFLALDDDGAPLHRWHHNIKTTSGGKTFALVTGTNTTVALNETAANAGEDDHSYYLFGTDGNLAFNGRLPYLSFIDRDRNSNSNRTDMRFDSSGGFYLQFANQGYSLAHNAIAVVRGESTNTASIALNANAVTMPGTLAVGGVITGNGSGITGDDEAYDASGWNSDTTLPTKNAVRDEMENRQPLDVDLNDLAFGITGIVKGLGSGLGYVFADAGVDYLEPDGDGSGLTDLNANNLDKTNTVATVANAGTVTVVDGSDFYSITASGATFNIDLPASPTGQRSVFINVTNTSGGAQVATLVDGELLWSDAGTYASTITNAQDTFNPYGFYADNGVWKSFSAPYVPVAAEATGVVEGIAADSGGTTTGATVTLAGGSGVTTTRSGDTVTIDVTPEGVLASGLILTTDNGATPIYTNTVAADYTKLLEATLSVSGPTNMWSGTVRTMLRNIGGTITASSNLIQEITVGGGGQFAQWGATGADAILYWTGPSDEEMAGAWSVSLLAEHTNGIATASETAYLLDKITNIVVAHASSAARKLTNTATSPFRIFRNVDAAEQDASFTGDVTDTASISSFISSGDGRVSKLYNQTGETAQDLLTTTTNRMPTIMIEGTLQTLGGFPALHLNIDDTAAYDDQITTAANYNQSQPWTVYAVVSIEEATGTDRFFASFGSTSRGAMGADATGPRVLMTSGSILGGPTIATTTMYLFRAVVNGGASEISLDGVAPTTGSAGANTMDRISLGQSSASLRSKVVEYIVLLDEPSTDLDTIIINDMMDYYNIGE